jgi:hypothetical protein
MRVLCVALTALWTVVVGRAWLSHYPEAPFILAVGMPYASPGVGTRCRSWYWSTRFGPMPMRQWTCEMSDGARPNSDRRMVALDGLTRRSRSARRMWTFADSLAWQRIQDSVTMELVGRGGVRRQCARSTTNGEIRRHEEWQFPTYAVRMIADVSPQPPRLPWQRDRWQLQLDAFPTELPTGYCPTPLQLFLWLGVI